MIAVDITTQGSLEVQRYLRQVAAKTSNPVPALKLAGEYLRSEYVRNMTEGQDPDGKEMTPPAVWTRVASPAAGAKRNLTNRKALMNTGRLRNSIGTVRLNAKEMEFGFSGKMFTIAHRMFNGIAGLMKVRSERIPQRYSGIRKSKKDGHHYLRVINAEQDDTGWITRQATSRGNVMVKPLARKFIYLSRKQAAGVIDIMESFVAKAVGA